MTVGDVKSDARGSGARFNDGKAPLDLIPLRILVTAWDRDGLSAAQEAARKALAALADWQESGAVWSLYGALQALGNPFHDVAAVLDYGRRKYSKRGDRKSVV